jgi:hypothetical protein
MPDHIHDAERSRTMAGIAAARIAAVLIAGAFVSSALAQSRLGPSEGTLPFDSTDPVVMATSRWDANRDGVFTCDEWKQYAGRLFGMADKNSDGFLDANELRQVGKLEPLFADADVAYFDADRDKRVSHKEFVDKPNPLFARFDANGDCRVTAQEIKNQGHAAGGEHRGPGGGRGGSGGGRPGGGVGGF